MRTMVAAFLLLLGANVARAADETFFAKLGTLKDGKLTMKKGATSANPGKEISLELAEGCKINKGKYNGKEMRAEVTGEAEGGVKNFEKERTPPFVAQVKTEKDKVIEIIIFNFGTATTVVTKTTMGFITSLDLESKKLTITNPTTKKEHKFTILDNVKVMRAEFVQGKGLTFVPLEDGLKNEDLKVGVPGQFMTDDAGNIVEMRVNVKKKP